MAKSIHRASMRRGQRYFRVVQSRQMRRRIRRFLLWLFRKIADPPPDQRTTIRKLDEALVELAKRDNRTKAAYLEQVAEWEEARQMAGAGPWQVSPATLQRTDSILRDAKARFDQPLAMRETINPLALGLGFGYSLDRELILQNVEWQRDISLSHLQFSRWGIQQIILICRLYYIKHPWLRRGINLSAAYVFGQGVELSSPDPDANEALKRFRERNKVSLGQIALTEQEKRKGYDGNLFWCLFADTQDKGETNVRVIDATEIQEIVCDPEDAETPWYYKRVWSARVFDIGTGQWKPDAQQRWYPALNYEPGVKPPTIGDIPVAWDAPIYHRKCGQVASWTFGCPRIFPAIEYAKRGRDHLRRCENVTEALSQVALHITTKGGQQAIAKAQDTFSRPPSSDLSELIQQQDGGGGGVNLITGPGTVVKALQTRAAGANPEEIKEDRNMTACCLEIPPTWLGDMETSNLSTAQTLDRPTELGFLLKQEEWQEDLTVMGIFALKVSRGAPSGKLREGLLGRSIAPVRTVEIREASRVMRHCHWVYEAAKIKQAGVIEVLCNFPAIREGDIPALVKATGDAMMIDRQGAAHGIDEKVAARKFFDLLGIDDGDQITEKMYPDASYDPDRTKDEPPPVEPPPPASVPAADPVRIGAALARVKAALEVRENGHA